MAAQRSNKLRATGECRAQAYAQGGLDGLCGIYAAVNALQHLRGRALSEEPAIELFIHLAKSIQAKFPDVLWEGTGVPEVRTILDHADEWAREHYGFGVERSEPLMKRAPNRDDVYWRRLQELLGAPRRALIVGLNQPWEHWSVLTAVTPRTLKFFDSISIKIARRRDFSIHEGTTYRIDPHQIFLLERVAL